MNRCNSDVLVLLVALSLCSCTQQSIQFETRATNASGAACTEHFVSSNMQGNPRLIDLQQVQKAFDETRVDDFNLWMSAFETRANLIYGGKEPLSYNASNTDGTVKVSGYISRSNQTTFNSGDDLVFKLERTERNTSPEPQSAPAQTAQAQSLSVKARTGARGASLFGDALRRGWGAKN